MKNAPYRAIKITLGAIALLLLLLATGLGGGLYYLYRNQDTVAAMVLKELNEMQKGHTQIQRAYVNPYANFPYISIDLQGLAFYAAQGDSVPIYAFQDVYLGFDIWKILAGDYTIKRIYANQGQLNLVKDANGVYNLLLAKSVRQKIQAPEKAGKIHLDLRQLVLENVKITQHDLKTKQFVAVQLDKMATSLSYIDEMIKDQLDVKFTIEEIKADTTTLFKNKHVHLNSRLTYDIAKNLLVIDPSEIELEEGEFKLRGTVDINKNAFVDIEVEGRKPDFKLITSFAPEYVYQRLKSYKNKGDIYFKGKIIGETLDRMPKIDLEFGCRNAQFINPLEQSSIRDLNFMGYFTNGEKCDLTTCELSIKSLSGKPEESIFNGSFHIKNFTNPYISIDLHSKLDLSTLKNFFPIVALKDLKGWATIDMTVDELLDYNDVQTTLGKLKDGTDSRLVLKEVSFVPNGFAHAIKGLNGELVLEAGILKIKQLTAKIKDSDISLQGSVTNLASYFHNCDTAIQANLSGKANLLDLQQLAGIDEKIRNLSLELAFTTSVGQLRTPNLVPQGEFWVKNLTMTLQNYPHTIHDTHVDLLIDHNQIRIKKLETIVDKSDIHCTGQIQNYTALLDSSQANQAIVAKLALTADQLNFDELLVYGKTNFMPQDYQHEIVKNLHLELEVQMPAPDLRKGEFMANTRIDLKQFEAQMQLHPLAFRQVAGKFVMQAGNLEIQDFHAKMGKSDFNLSGQIDSVLVAAQMKSKKVLSFKANVLDLDELLTLPNTAAVPVTNPSTPAQPDHDSGFNLFALPFPKIALQLEIGTLRYKKYLVNELVGKLRTTPDHHLYIDTMAMQTAGGRVGVAGYFNGSNKNKIYLKGKIKVADLDFDRLFYKLDNFGQDYLVSNNLHGKLSGTIDANVRMHTDFTPDLQETQAHIEGTIREGSIHQFAPFRAMSDFFADKDLDNIRFAEMTNTFDYQNGIISFPKMEIATSVGYIFIQGKQSLDTSMDYEVQVPLKIIKQATWDYLFKRKKSAQAGQTGLDGDEVVEDIISSREKGYKKLVNIRINGKPDNYTIKLVKSREN